jgi:hypothetical protein
VRVYPDRILRVDVKTRLSEAIEWTPLGLPEAYLPLIALNRSAFRVEDRIVAHGRTSREEVIVPPIRIERRAL